MVFHNQIQNTHKQYLRFANLNPIQNRSKTQYFLDQNNKKLMQIAKRLNENNFNQVARLIQTNPIPHDLMKGNIKNELKRYEIASGTPASVKLAQIHQKAVKYGFKQPLRGRPAQTCGCCNFRIQSESVSICQTVAFDEKRKKDMQFNNTQYKFRSDVALFLQFIKTLIYFLLIHMLIHSIFSIYTSQFIGQFCDDLVQCHGQHIWNTLSMSNKIDRQDLINVVDILSIVAVLTSIAFFICFRRIQYKMYKLIEEQGQTQQDYTLLISNIPVLDFPKKGEESGSKQKLEFYYRKHLEDYFSEKIEKWLKSKGEFEAKKDAIGKQVLKLMNSNNGELRSDEIVKSVSLCYNLSRLEVLKNIKGDLIQQFESQTEDQSTSLMREDQQGQPVFSERFSSIPQRVKFLNDCQLIINGQFARDSSFLFSVTHFVGYAFVSFQYQHFKAHILQKFKSNKKSFLYNSEYLKVEEASQSTDVFWENMRISNSQRKRRTIYSYVVLGFIVLLSFIIMLALNFWKNLWSKSETGESTNLIKSILLTCAVALLIMIFNWIISHVAVRLTKFERRKTRTDYSYSLLGKLFIFKLINTIMLYFCIALFLGLGQKGQKFMGPNGLILQISILVVISSMVHILGNLLYFQNIWIKLKRWWRYRKQAQSGKIENKFQITLNQEYEFPEFNMTQRYTYYLVTLHLSLFYSYLIPVIIPIIIIAFFIQYWIDKFNILRRSSLKYHFSFQIARKINKIYESSILAYVLGNLIFSIFVHNYNVGIINIVAFGIGLAYVLLIWFGPNSLKRMIFGTYKTYEEFTYDDCINENKFLNTYWTQNPATFLIEESKVTGKRGAANPNNYRLSKDPIMTSVL